LVWDLRISNEIPLCYSTVDEYDACCNCSLTSNYFINASAFSSATSIYTDSSLTILAADGWYQAGGTYRQLLSGVLLDPISCPVCGACITWSGGTFKGAGGFSATFSYLDCNNLRQDVVVPIPVNITPDIPMDYDVNLGSGVCVIPGSIELLIPAVIPSLTIEYGSECVTPIECLSYTVWTYTNGGANYLDCEGNPQSISIGGSSGYDQAVFCAEINSVVTTGDSNLIINGDCI
jgi:hypothetical protein